MSDVESEEDDVLATQRQKDAEEDRVLEAKTYDLNLDPNSCPDWLPKHAFREFYQNWRDGLVESFKLDPRALQPTFDTNNQREVRITMSRVETSSTGVQTSKLAGYIIFNARRGSVEMTNFNAKLERKHLRGGGTNKRGKPQFAGGHGEGFKLAALVLRRSGYDVRFETTSFCWKFKLHDQLKCRLTVPTTRFTQDQQALRSESEFAPDITKDMTVRISKSRDRSDPWPSQKVTEEDFREWMKISIDLHRPEEGDVVHTVHGDLILDPDFRGRVYLKGLLLEHAGYGRGGGQYHYGYNFHQGTTDRDRKQTTDPQEEGRMLAKIWEKSIVSKGEAVMKEYIQLFQEDENCIDIARAPTLATSVTAENISKYLKDSQPRAFFYSERDSSVKNAPTDEDIISKEIKRNPVKLPRNLWDVIRRCDPSGRYVLRTPLEKRARLFRKSQAIELPTDVFSVNVDRALRGSLSGNQNTRTTRVEFVDGANTNINLLYDQNTDTLRVHAKWLDFSLIHEESPCDFFKIAQEQPQDLDGFFCDHVVQNLLVAAFNELRGPLGMAPEKAERLQQNADEYFRQMPRSVRMKATTRGGRLKVTWRGNETGPFVEQYGASIRYLATLHKESSCGHMTGQVLNVDYIGKSSTKVNEPSEPCGCPGQIVAYAQSAAIFEGLDHTETYFPMVSRAVRPSFFGLPPPAIAPNQPTFGDTDAEDDAEMEAHGELREEQDVDMLNDEPAEETDEDVIAGTTAAATRLQDQAAAAEADEKTWKEWHGNDLSSAFAKFAPARSAPGQTTDRTSIAYLHSSPDYTYTFEKNRYVRIQLRGESTEKIIFVHNIYQPEPPSDSGEYLLVTFYSPLSSILASDGSEVEHTMDSPHELVLHFGDIDKMKTLEDAEKISLADISHTRSLPANQRSVSHVFKHLPGDPERWFCRFGICNNGAEGVALLTPLPSHLCLEDEEPWDRPRFTRDTKPLAFDLSSGVLGLSEGFSQRGYTIQAGFEIDETKASTWTNRYSSAQLFDGTVLDVVDEFSANTLPRYTLPEPTPPCAALLAGKHKRFRLQDDNEMLPTLQQFTSVLETIDKTAVDRRPDFIAMFVAPALLHAKTSARLLQTLLGLLKLRLSVHLKLVQVRDYGLPQERTLLVIVASPVCAALPRKDARNNVAPTNDKSLGALIEDLAFKNSRLADGSSNGFVCSAPGSPEHVYNHYTGIGSAIGQERIEVEADSILDISDGPKMWMHWDQDRHDRLTVRELARIQGIPDDLWLRGTIDSQYEEVCRAVPPVIAQMVAHTIRQAIDDTMPARSNARNLKRPMLGNDESDREGQSCPTS
ncbi:hypothetical protein H2200_000209 [Cladophialophora chaetospira]|uniref:DNA (cytosine-5-)-methyltransferase n=1 Tax=Cladophialophora chaetospira TaxID=386627 RepID=A0AA38XN00_9EURO|nr:hypothetical protein H2200_000209 [Cladophialophora chaetospira]